MILAISNLLPAVAWTLISGLVLTVGDIMLRSWIQSKWAYGFETAFVVYMLGVSCMMLSFLQQNIAVATVAAIILNAVGYIIASYVAYGDTISLTQAGGIVLGLIAFTILELA